MSKLHYAATILFTLWCGLPAHAGSITVYDASNAAALQGTATGVQVDGNGNVTVTGYASGVVPPPGTPPVCSVGLSPSGTITAGQAVTVTANCNPAATSWSWSGSSTPNPGTSQSAVLTPATGTYTYTVTGTNDAGPGAVSAAANLTVNAASVVTTPANCTMKGAMTWIGSATGTFNQFKLVNGQAFSWQFDSGTVPSSYFKAGYTGSSMQLTISATPCGTPVPSTYCERSASNPVVSWSVGGSYCALDPNTTYYVNVQPINCATTGGCGFYMIHQ